MPENTTVPHSVPDETDRLAQIRGVSKAFKANVEAENERLRTERNARRFKAERDPVEYAKQKVEQREQYAAEIAKNEDREVRSYLKIEAANKIERDVIRKERNAETKRKSRANATPEDRAARADKVWEQRAIKRGLTQDQIAEGLAKRRRDQKFNAAPYSENDDYGKF